jgi:hypothetical protein
MQQGHQLAAVGIADGRFMQLPPVQQLCHGRFDVCSCIGLGQESTEVNLQLLLACRDPLGTGRALRVRRSICSGWPAAMGHMSIAVAA